MFFQYGFCDLITTLEISPSADKGNQKLLSPDAFPGLNCHRNALAAGASPWTLVGELTSLFQTL